MSNKELINEIRISLKNLDREQILKLSKMAIDKKMDILEIMEKGFGDLYNSNVIEIEVKMKW